MRKSNAGRPTVMTDVVIGKLEEAYALGCTDGEACFYAGIAASTLYDYQIINPEFVERKESLKQRPIFVARKSVVDSLATDSDLAMKFLERKRKDEFSLRTENDLRVKELPKPLLGGTSVSSDNSN